MLDVQITLSILALVATVAGSLITGYALRSRQLQNCRTQEGDCLQSRSDPGTAERVCDA